MNKNFPPHSKTPLEAVRDKFTKESKGSCLCDNTLNIGYWKVILLALFTLSFIGCEKIFPKTSPMSIIGELPASNDAKRTRTAILTGIQNLKWEVEGEAEGQIDLVRRDQEFMAAIRITYDEHDVKFHYLRSENLLCEPEGSSCAKIHGLYGEWSHTLKTAVNNELQIAKFPPEAWRKAMEPSRPKAVGSGTGFVVSRLGHVLTNHHVVDGCTTIRARTADAYTC
ncbi:MAG: serine protease [Nitrospirales bacterium]|nr:MAG: serine protease [Nitrospirales bacterium]